MSAPPSEMSKLEAQGITIRRFSTPEEMKVCVHLQREVWGFSDMEIVPDRMFIVAHRTGGQVLGAFAGERAVGFLLAFTASRKGEMYIHSHMTAVLPNYQNQGIGRQLKLAQRDEALRRSVNLIEWTFDPLQMRNAHFNVTRLGAIVREYLPNFYGSTSSPLHHGLPTDRLVAQWWIGEPRVQEILSGKARASASGTKKICVPRSILDICEQEPERARQLQSQIRLQFQELFGQGFTVSGFEMDEQNGWYVLECL